MNDEAQHEHAKSGLDFGLLQVGILVLRLRPGRQFTLEEVQERHMPAVKRWVHRSMAHTQVMGMDPIVEADSFSMFQRDDALVVRFKVTLGWEPDFLCYALAFATDPTIDPVSLMHVVLNESLPGHGKKPMVH